MHRKNTSDNTNKGNSTTLSSFHFLGQSEKKQEKANEEAEANIIFRKKVLNKAI